MKSLSQYPKGPGAVVLFIAAWMNTVGCGATNELSPHEESAHAPVFSLGTVSQTMLSSPAWRATGSPGIVDRAWATTVRLNSGNVLVAGGSTASSQATSVAELYNPGTGTWSPVNAMANARRDHAAVLLSNGEVLVVGGYNFPNVLATAERFNENSNSWSNAGSLAWPRDNLIATLLTTGKVLVTGDATTAELYDLGSNSWSSAGTVGVRRVYHTATLLPDGRVLVAGGMDSTNAATASAELYDPETNSWSVAASMATPRWIHTATLLPDGKVLVAGGWNDVAGAELYDPQNNSWSPAGAMSTPRGAHTAVLVNGKVLVSGGVLGSNAFQLQTAELYNPVTKSWATAPSMTIPRAFHDATVLANGRVLVVGGGGIKGAELYHPTDIDLRSVVGYQVAQGTSCGATNVFTPICATSYAPEISFTWTAPYAGTFTFSTTGSPLDTVLQIQDDTTGNLLGCNDDAYKTPQSSLILPLSAGQRITLIIDAYHANCGNYVLNITP